jgi:hypothetical protein
MNAYQEFYNKHSCHADIYIIYILEAHFVEKNEKGEFIDGWPIGYQYNYGQPKTIEERRHMVDILIDEYHPKIPILMDKIDNNFQNAYNPWPDRAFVFLDGKIKYIAKINDDGTRNSFWTNEIDELITDI